MEQTMRWFGETDPVSLSDIRQAGATGIVTALHHIPNGEVWNIDDIKKRKKLIENAGLRWSVVESVPVHEDIKTHSGNYDLYIKNYQETLRNLSACGIDTVCYNFMPVLDWTRTDLAFTLKNGAKALRFDFIAFAAFDLYILQRKNAQNEYSEMDKKEAKSYFVSMNDEEKSKLVSNIIAGLPGSEEGYSLDQFRAHLAKYDEIDEKKLRENMAYFLNKIVPVAEDVNIKLAVHPDDPPYSILGLPRIISTINDMAWLVSVNDSIHNGFTFCTGSYGVRRDNDLVKMVDRFAPYIHFIHLRSTKREENEQRSFYEADHLGGDVDMFLVIKQLVHEEIQRKNKGDLKAIPMRPDHGHQMLDDLHKKTNPGYSAIGRLKGLAEIRGVELAILRACYDIK